jgi:hypothetical protein
MFAITVIILLLIGYVMMVMHLLDRRQAERKLRWELDEATKKADCLFKSVLFLTANDVLALDMRHTPRSSSQLEEEVNTPIGV